MTRQGQHIFVLGYPGDVGGASTECWHTLKLWRSHGVQVTLIPTWTRPADKWLECTASIGCETIHASPTALPACVRGGVCVAFCNTRFLDHARWFLDNGCRIIWVPCMNWVWPQERLLYAKRGVFDAYVFQSRFCWAHQTPQLAKFGYQAEQGHIIPGAFDVDEFPFCPRPHAPGQPFVVGRLSRAADDKYSRATWDIYRWIKEPRTARVMAWDDEIEEVLGKPPEWAECLPAGAESSKDFLASLHCIVQSAHGHCCENWPRVGLEAMASGVPLIVDDRGGWREMLRHGKTGFMCESPTHMADHASRLAGNEALRQNVARAARQSVEQLAAPEPIWRGWEQVFKEVGT